MKWKRIGKKDKGDVIDVRGAGPARRGGSGGGFGGIPVPAGAGGIGGGLGLVILLVVLGLQMCGDGSSGSSGFSLDDILGPGAAPPSAENPQPLDPEEDPQKDLKDFSSAVFVDAQNTWDESFTEAGKDYSDAKLVLYSQSVNTGGCGGATSAVGPFYCPADSRVYLDLTFYEDMERQLGAKGDFAWAYVIAHELGHHVQSVDGTNAEVTNLQRSEPDEANELSVRLELQADCYSGVWGATVFAEGDLEEGDLAEAFTAAEAVGDDRLQEQAGQRINPDSFTHGTSEQRRTWFEKGYSSADPASCDTFSPDEV
jgi:predicted metalloprotease